MTKNPPEGQYGYQQQGQYGQEQYGGQQPYGGYNSGEAPYQNYQQPQQGYGAPPGTAQSYYGSNDQPYQQYPQDRPMNQPPPGYNPGGPAAPYPPQHHGYSQPDQYGAPQPPQYGQEYPPPQHYAQQYGSGGDVDAFRSHFDQPHAQGQYGGPPPPGAPPGSEADRGLMGALAGGAAGAWGGHQMGHGVIGGIGGAVAGSVLEDKYKKHHKKEKKHKDKHHRRGSSSSSSSSSSSDSDSDHKKRHDGVAAGNFFASCRQGSVHLEGRSTLVAEACDTHGHHHRSEIDLNDCFTNTDGRMLWARGGNFAASARNIRLADHGKVLEAELGDGRGGWQHNAVYLDERITNDNGRLALI